MNLGVKEAQDQNEVARYMGSLPYVDKDNIGIWGWSYGGYCTLMSLTEAGSIFKTGVAVAPVTDWKYYDSVYGERFMRTPKENGDGYKTSSTFTRAENLNAKLLIMHGLADDNVHFQNTAEYGEELVQLGKQYDQQVFNNRNHSIYGGNTRLYLFTRLTNFFKDNLK
jgi:dipeptidyl-peptidase-4